MGVKKVSTSSSTANKMPVIQKKSMLSQVMKPRDWAAIGVLVIVSAFCWAWVLNVYQETIGIDNFVSGTVISQTIDKKGIL